MKKTLLLLTLATLSMTGAHAATSPTVVLYTDPVADGVVLGPALPPLVDLIEGSITETDTHLLIDWKVVEIPDGTNGLPGLQRLDFEFTLDIPGDAIAPEDFGVRLETTRGGSTLGYIDASCTQGSTVSCTRLNSAVVTTSVDAATNTFRAAVRRSDLRSGGVPLAVDGAVLEEFFMYRGIASYLGVAGFLVTHNLSDQADLPAPYVLGSAWGA
jgi:hypothetical protein